MVRQLKVTIVFLVSLFLFCSSERGTKNRNIPEEINPGAEETSQMAKEKEQIRNVVGTIVYNEIEGGFYGIKSDDGSKYNPVNLEESFRQDGLRVKIDARLKKDMVGIHMWGEYIEITKIEELVGEKED